MRTTLKCALVSLFVSSSFLSAEIMKVEDLQGIASKVMDACKDKKSDDISSACSNLEMKDARLTCYGKDGKISFSSDKDIIGKDATNFKDENGKSILDLTKDKLKDAKNGEKVSFTAMVNGKKRNIVAFMIGDMVCTVAAAAE